MTNHEMEKIAEYRQAGYTHGQIAEIMGLPAGTIKSYLHRHVTEPSENVCLMCGEPIRSIPHHKAKKFCSDRCRMLWWNSHPEQVNRTRHTQTCPQCGKSFETHIAAQRYCSLVCASAARRKGAENA